jgi:hypothetical protein
MARNPGGKPIAKRSLASICLSKQELGDELRFILNRSIVFFFKAL